MHDDVSSIPSDGCTVLTGTSSISNYNGRIRKDYVENGGKWYHYRTQTSTYNDYDISSYTCIDVQQLNSYAVYQPFLYAVAFGLFLVVLALVIKTVKGFLYGI